MAVLDVSLLEASARDALEDTFTIQGVQARQPRLAHGGYDWNWRGPRRDPEWAWFFNRHHWLPALHYVYTEHDSRPHLDALLATLEDWIDAHPPPGRISFSPAWRPLEAARRLLSSWMPLWPSLAVDPRVPDAFRAKMRASMAAHGEHLRHHHAFGGNHLVTEMLALVRLALLFPEHARSDGWLDYALRSLEKTHRAQVYPDGSYKELSTHYQRIVTVNYQTLPALLAGEGRADLAEAWERRIAPLWDYIHGVMTPSGGNPLNNDSDHEHYQGLLDEHRPDLAQTPPAATRHFPWAGQTVFRSGADGQWGFFDAGPRGTDHQHADLLSFTLSLGADDLLVDNGRHSYRPGAARDYFAGPAGHNVLLLDGRGSSQGPRALTRPPATERFARLDGGASLAWGDAIFASPANAREGDWRRIVLHLPTGGWVVIDRLVIFTPRRLETLWHWHPDVTVTADDDGRTITAAGAGQSLRVLAPESAGEWSLVRGRTEPVWQGWHSRRFNQRDAATCAIFTQRVDRPTLNVWSFAPRGLAAPMVKALDGGHRLRVDCGGVSCELDLTQAGDPRTGVG